MATVHGILKSIIAAAVEPGTVEVALCGYGSYLPRAKQASLVARPATLPEQIPVDPATGAFNFTVPGNDEIAPAGTYYAITMKDSNGDIIQCAAYLFLGDGDYDLDVIPPYDPSLPPPPLPPLIIPQLLIVPPSAAANFPGDIYTAWKITLDKDVLGATISNIVPGNLYTFIVVQDATGGHKFGYPTGPPPDSTRNTTSVCPEPLSTTIQTCVADENGILWSIGPGTWTI